MLGKYPIGNSDFTKIRTQGKLYVDKTDLVYQITSDYDYCFLSRPRRFGKSLLVSTLEAYFQGQKELFAGLAMEGLERDWVKYPVLHLDLSRENFTAPGVLEKTLNTILGNWERIYGREAGDDTFAARFIRVIERAHAQTGRRVVVLVDEYDKPLLDAIDDEALLARNQDALRGFYGVLKGMDAHLRFVFLTGITRFAHLGLFSGLNNLRDLSMDEAYATLCGITEGELRADLAEGVARLAARRGQTVEEAYGKLKEMYDGYRFSPDVQAGVYNPFSLLSALEGRRYGRYWYETGTPRFLFRLIEKRRVPIAGLARGRMRAGQLRGRAVSDMGIVPLLYQTGYMTIECYDEAAEEYTLRFPNGEVERAFYDDLVQYFFRVDEDRGLSIPWLLGRMEAGDAAGLMAGLYAFISGFSYRIAGEAELYFQNVLVVLFRGLGLEMRAELATSDGRIDALVETPGYIYLFEFKLDKSAEAALAQIEAKGYAAPFALGQRAVVKLGVNFSSKTRNIAGCIIRAEGQEDVRMAVQAGRLRAVEG